jgi:hypothetical protein
MAQLLFSTEITNTYKEVSEVIDSIDMNKKVVRKMSLKSMMEESFFHGASMFGAANFIA